MCEEHAKSGDLSIFSGMEGFEELSPSDDSTLVALLDDLKEETLMTLLDCDMFIKDLNTPIGSNSPESDIEYKSPISLMEVSQYAGGDLDSCRKTKHTRSETLSSESSKKVKIDDEDPTKDFVLASIKHDHCYASTKLFEGHVHQSSCSNSDEEPSLEEGSSSDTGYDTMSSSASPGSSNSRVPDHTSVLPKPDTIDDIVDPVALIDARIKHYMCSREVNLTEEEKEILKSEGLPIPTTLPLTKTEEKALKNVRRKIRNRVAAQESRKRKKEMVQTLEERVSAYNNENVHLKKRVKALENENRLLMDQLMKLQSIIKSQSNNGNAKVGTCIMVIILCFAIFLGGSYPSELWNAQKQTDYATTTVRSRSLLSVNPKLNFPTSACDWFKHTFMMEKQSSDVMLDHSHYSIIAWNFSFIQSNFTELQY